ncbi:Restriction modification system DNA specificity domain-containing protein [Xanthomonas citri pv. bilvae]|nr:Restriction modification system DNA specificity domain-containing protein [Xanthomonas citri pv. bilvae]
MTALLTDNLPLLAGAPNGIKKLRELILELAVRGKLVPQDASDEPASELLKRIAGEKARLVAEGEIKRGKALAKIGAEEKPFELPGQWAWVRLADLASPQAGFAFKSGGFNTSGLGSPLIRIRDVGQEFSGTFYEGEYRSEFVVEGGDYLISMDGQFRVATWQGDTALLNQRVSRLIFFGNESVRRFIASSLQARLLELQGVKAYTTVDHLSGGQISEAVIALPPLAEQHRIVAKVDELMALCDRLEARQADADSAHAQLVQALLGSLTQARDADDFAQSWQRLAEHFHTLFTTEPSIDALKQTLLQLAVMGKLVPQDPSDEPASAVVNRIHAEKQRYLAESKARRQKDLTTDSPMEPSFEAPDGWEWRTIDDVLHVTGGVTLGRKLAGRKLMSKPYLRVANVQRGRLEMDHIKEVEVPEDEVEKYLLQRGDLLITEGGDWDKVGRTATWRDELPECLHQNHVFRARAVVADWEPRWAEMYLNSASARE